MFGISFYELLVIIVIYLVIFKPSEYINILFSLGKFINKIKNFIYKLQDDFDKVANLGELNDYEIKEKSNLDNKYCNKKRLK